VVLFAGEQRNGAVRSFFDGSIQPSELAKIVVVLYLSVWLYAKREDLGNIGFGLLPLMVILGVLGGLILLQPDLSAAITIIMLGGLLFFLAGGDLRQIMALGIGAIIIGFLIVYFNPTGSSRLGDYLAGLKDPTQGSYHVRRAFGAFANGGWFGVGLGEADAKLTGLPVAPTDSIFAVIGEETGVVGAAALVCLYLVLLWRGLTIARRAPDPMGALLAAGLSLWIVLEAFINMAVMINLLPFAGNALPFISAGGSSLVSTLAAVGIIMNISRLSEAGSPRSQKEGDHGRLFHAVVDLRRRDGRRRVSSAGGATDIRRATEVRNPRTQRPRP
jgi:cell division protein FtsW